MIWLWTALAAPSGPAHILGGAPADPADWPDLVALLAEGEQLCTGVLVAPDRVLTAAHCQDVDEAVIGAARWQEGERVQVVDRVVPSDGPVDVALLTLASSSEARLHPWTMPCEQPRPAEGAAAAIVGYGAVDEQSIDRPGELRVGAVTIRDPDCEQAALGCTGMLHGVEMVAGADGVDSCIGDSGGPLFLAHGAGWRLAGTTSRGVLGQRTSCGGGGIYTRTDAIAGWLEDQGLRSPQDTSCTEVQLVHVGCGCSTSGRGGWWLFVLAVLARWRRGWPSLLIACGEPPVAEEADTSPPRVWTLGELLAEPPEYGSGLIVGPLRVATGRTIGTGMVYLQDPEGGRLVEVRPGRLDGWPPPVGTDITARLYWVGLARLPVMWLSTMEDLLDTSAGGELRMLQDPADPPTFALARWSSVRVLSDADPTGRAMTSLGRDLVDRFGTGLPGRTSEGSLISVVLPDGALAPRAVADWQGSLAAPPPASTTLAALRGGAHADGEQVTLLATQVTPWSRGDRYTVIQDESGRGVWVDAEGLGHGVGGPGEQGWWTGQVRRDRDVVYLRVWSPPEPLGPGLVVGSGAEEDGALVERRLTGLGSPDLLGERSTAEGWVLDDRFMDLSDLQPGLVRGVIERRGNAAVRLAPLP